MKPIVASAAHRYAPRSMLNDRSSILSLLETRRSGKPRDLVGPGPTPEEMDRILTIAARVPDHGKLSPWRFVLVDEDQREDFAQLLRDAMAEEQPGVAPPVAAKAGEFAQYGGQLVVLLAAPVQNHKIPVWEQELSVGTAGMNLLIAAHALGYVAGWVTGWQAVSPKVNAAFCGPGERIAGFIFIGHPARELEERPRPRLEDVSRKWTRPEL